MAIAKQSSFEFIKYHLEALSFQKHNVPRGGGVNYQYDLQFHTESHHINAETGNKTDDIYSPNTHTIINLTVAIVWEGEGPFDCKIQLQGVFGQDGNMPPEFYQDYVDIHAPSVLLAHARPIINTLMRDAQEPFVFPLFNISEAIRADRAKKASEQPPASAPEE